jgi:hypothetical protein
LTETDHQGSTPDFWVGLDPDLNCRDDSLSAIHQYWLTKRAARRMPSRDDIDPVELGPHLGNIVLIDVEHDPLRLRYRLIGTKITEAMARDSTGKYYDKIYSDELLENIYESFRWIIDNKKPVRTYGEAFYPDRDYYVYETLNLPLSNDDEAVNMVLGCLVFHRKSSVGATMR